VKTYINILLSLVLLCATSGSQLYAEPWNGKGELGVVLARGNSEAETINAKLEMAKVSDEWKNAFTLAALQTASDGARSAERYGATWQTDFRFNSRSYWFSGARYEDDRFSGFNYQASLSSGLGHLFIEDDERKLFGQAGIGYRRLENALTGSTDGSVIFSGELRFEQQITETTSLRNKLIVEAGDANTFAVNELALQVKINNSLSLAAGIGVRHNTDPPSGREKTDTLTTLNLVYGF